jgi:hypothetical protein
MGMLTRNNKMITNNSREISRKCVGSTKNTRFNLKISFPNNRGHQDVED